MSSRILLIDNYDSFVYNLARYFQELGVETAVLRNDAFVAEDVARIDPAAIVISPGPCTPAESGICVDVVRNYCDSLPILGVCLGHQVIAASFGGRIARAHSPMHGESSLVLHRGSELFAGCPNPIRVGRYHSLIVDEQTLPGQLVVTSRLQDGTVMSIEHRQHAVYGVQFHPESILTEDGYRILENFLRLAGITVDTPCQGISSKSTQDQIDDFYRREITFDSVRPI